MERRTLGEQGLEVSAVGLGCMGMSEFYGSPERSQGIEVIHRALDLGVDFLGVNGRPSYVREACHDSLRRLGVDHIDLYYQHRVDPDVPVEETARAVEVGLSETELRRIDEGAPKGGAAGDRYPDMSSVSR